eukprot:XP_011674217.1 PREDICTED: uncharacterized protein LOC105443097 [Strongylocentrotus purpuratus]
MDVAEFIFIFLGLLSFVRASDIPNSCEGPPNTAEKESEDFSYIGCYERACFKNTTSFTISSINECTGACKNESSRFAALEFGHTCYCGEFDCIDQPDKERCDNKCGIPCQGGHDHELKMVCGGKGYIQVYQDITDDTKSREDDAGLVHGRGIILTVAIGAVIFITVAFLICLGLVLAGRRNRSQGHRQRPVLQADLNQMSNIEMTSLNSRDRRCRQNNQYSFSDCRLLNPSNTTTGSTTPLVAMQLSSDNMYDHIASRGRIPANAGNLKPPTRSPAPRLHPATFPIDHGKGDHSCQDGGDVCSGVSSSEIKSGAESSCRRNELKYEMASTSPNLYFTLETSEEQSTFEKDSQMGMKARRGNLENIASCPREKIAEDESSLYAYATCSDQSQGRRFYSKPKVSECQDDNDYDVISDTQNQRKNHNR